MDNAQRKPVITQEMIALFDDFTHRSLDRRKFMDDLAKLAGSTAAAVTAASLMASSASAAGLTEENAPGISVKTVTYPGAKGTMTGYLVEPKGAGPFPAVIVIHENRGLNPHIKDVARRVGLEGFIALAPDFLSDVGGTPADEDAARSLFSNLSPADTTANGIASIAYLKSLPNSTGKVGAMGFCWGGGAVNQLAVGSPELMAGVAYYGAQPKADDVRKIKAMMMLHYGGLDERINAGIPAFKAALDKAKINYQLYVYEGANHAFNNDTSAARYDKAAADLAWSRSMAMFRDVLG